MFKTEVPTEIERNRFEQPRMGNFLFIYKISNTFFKILFCIFTFNLLIISLYEATCFRYQNISDVIISTFN